MTPPIIQARVSSGYVVELLFDDGRRVDLDLGPFLRANADHEAIEPYLDPDLFAGVRVEDGDLTWGEDWDIMIPAAAARSGRIEAVLVSDAD